RLGPDLTTRRIMTSGPKEHGEPAGTYGLAALPAPDGHSFAYVEVHDGLVDLLVAPLEPADGRRSGRPSKARNERSADSGIVISPWPGVWRAVDWLPDGSAVLAIGESG